ncbi:aryl-alcohol dehydrogenase-like predicted oxidoreductase [Microbacterium sp. ZKA21]|uniref:aldo/keto reductase n=1 Tax=Microbacterium sp. ZKA21 TaxID=3381694 RepID=UPI003D19C4B5
MKKLAQEKDATAAQIASAWLLAKYPSIVPVPGIRHIDRIRENAAATQVSLSADELSGLNALARDVGVAGDRYDARRMAFIDR